MKEGKHLLSSDIHPLLPLPDARLCLILFPTLCLSLFIPGADIQLRPSNLIDPKVASYIRCSPPWFPCFTLVSQVARFSSIPVLSTLQTSNGLLWHNTILNAKEQMSV